MASQWDYDENYTRGVAAPDGDYLITMPGWFWAALDWMNTETKWKEEDFIKVAWTTAKQMENDGTMLDPGNFQNEFCETLKTAISYRYQWFDHQEKGASNTP